MYTRYIILFTCAQHVILSIYTGNVVTRTSYRVKAPYNKPNYAEAPIKLVEP